MHDPAPNDTGHLTTNPQAEPVLPDYDGACLTNLVPALLADHDDSPDWLPPAVRRATQVVLLVIDGLGWEQLRDRASLAPTLAAAAQTGRAVTSVVPTTTATALTSIATGRPPSEHGVVGYRLAVAGDQVLNVLRWQVGSGRARDARQTIPVGQFQPYTPFPGASAPIPVVSRAEFGGTGFTAVHLGDSPLHGYRVLSTMVVETRRLLAQGSPFVYAYYDGVDKVAHAHGLGEHYDAELQAVDRLVADMAGSLPDGAVLVVTADHGQVDVGPRVVLLGQGLMAAVTFLSGEGRFRWLHTRSGAAPDVLDEAGELYGDSTWVRSREQLIDDRWFGGAFRDGVASRLGDVALIPHAPIAFLDPADTGETRLAARHGSLTSAEMLVPLLCLAGDGNISP
ncbi:MAG TPA: alkaline phosphatase family protein [Acidimicrobiales bacterium]|nr:alkaline phosphatase family protein [Acidimicrobiales bacterium]